MKKLSLTLALALALVFSSNAQISFGAKAGVNFAKLTGDIANAKSRTSFVFGAMAEIPITEKFSFQPELLYSSQGAKGEETDFDGTYKEELKFDYLNLPLMAKYYVAENFSLEVGPQIGFLLSAKEEYDYPDESGSEDVKDSLESIDFVLNFGLGYKLDNGLNFGARYNLGLSNIAKGPDAGKVRNGLFQITVGYFFN